MEGHGEFEEHLRHAGLLRLLMHHLAMSLLRLLHMLILSVQPVLGQDGKACLLQTFLRRHHKAGIHIAGACAALYGTTGAGTVQSQLAGQKGQCPVIFHQDHTLSCQLSGQLHVLLLVRRHVRTIRCQNLFLHSFLLCRCFTAAVCGEFREGEFSDRFSIDDVYVIDRV